MVLRGLLRLGVGVQKLQQLQLLRWEVRRLVMGVMLYLTPQGLDLSLSWPLSSGCGGRGVGMRCVYICRTVLRRAMGATRLRLRGYA